MVIFGERVNGMYRDVRAAIKKRDKDVVKEIVREQLDGGADVTDLNIGPVKGDPVDNFLFLVECCREVTDNPVAIDSAKAQVIEKVVPKIEGVKVIINSTTADPDVMDRLVPIAAEKGGIVGLTMDKGGVPASVEKRVECGANFLMKAMEAGLAVDDIYIDTIVLPVNVAPKGPANVMDAIRQLRMVTDPPPHFILGLSNVSQKCLQNRLINRIYLSMAISAGLDAAIMDATDKELVEAAVTAEVLMEKHLYSDDYLKAWRMQKGI